MRRIILCCLSLALCFTLTVVLQESSAFGGDLLPPGGCQFFADSDFAPLEPDRLVLPEPNDASTAAPNVQPVPALAYVPRSVRKWNFNYRPVKTPTAKTTGAKTTAPVKARVKLLWHTQQVRFLVKPTTTVPIRSQRKHTAPVLFWDAGTLAEMTIAANLIGRQIGNAVLTGVSPSSRMPLRMVNIATDCFDCLGLHSFDFGG